MGKLVCFSEVAAQRKPMVEGAKLLRWPGPLELRAISSRAVLHRERMLAHLEATRPEGDHLAGPRHAAGEQAELLFT